MSTQPIQMVEESRPVESTPKDDPNLLISDLAVAFTGTVEDTARQLGTPHDITQFMLESGVPLKTKVEFMLDAYLRTTPGATLDSLANIAGQNADKQTLETLPVQIENGQYVLKHKDGWGIVYEKDEIDQMDINRLTDENDQLRAQISEKLSHLQSSKSELASFTDEKISPDTSDDQNKLDNDWEVFKPTELPPLLEAKEIKAELEGELLHIQKEIQLIESKLEPYRSAGERDLPFGNTNAAPKTPSQAEIPAPNVEQIVDPNVPLPSIDLNENSSPNVEESETIVAIDSADDNIFESDNEFSPNNNEVSSTDNESLPLPIAAPTPKKEFITDDNQQEKWVTEDEGTIDEKADSTASEYSKHQQDAQINESLGFDVPPNENS
ncbi:MAG: hypothetical protein ACPGUD_10100 [Parashewanella sp.]